jgi:hypothetical protein
MFVLRWAIKQPPFKLNWVGPNKITNAISTLEEAQAKLAVISGPRGEKGDKGDPGTVGGIPTDLDGGNF